MTTATATPSPVGTRFKALQDFEEPELRSGYAAGLSYQVREGNDVLARFVPQWVAEGKVQILPEGAAGVGPASAEGVGHVT